MARHIGVVGCSIDGAALCYRTVCQGASAGQEISVHNMPWDDYLEHLRNSDWKGIASLMLASAHKLARAGAELIICPDNTIHEVFDTVSERSPRPWLHIAEVVVEEAVARRYRRLGLIGTRQLMNGPVYQRMLSRYGLELCIPNEEDQQAVDTIIFEELNKNVFSDDSRLRVQQVIGQFQQQECNAVILGCTELPLLIAPQDSPLPVLDSTRLLAQAALRASLLSTADQVFHPHLFLWGRIRIP
jgi:aspartate racemase